MGCKGAQLLKNAKIRLQDISTLGQAHCRMRDPERVERILNELVLGGPERMQIVTDFDYTITKQRMDNGFVPSSFGIFNACPSLPPHFVNESKNLYHKYRPIEIDPHMSLEEKVQHMVDWWTSVKELTAGFPFNEKEIDEIAMKYKDSLRDRTQELFEMLNALEIPVLVFSAGQGDAVLSMLRHANVLYPNVKVVSNFLEFKDGLLNGFKEPMIHTFNKNETVLHGSEYYDLVRTRDHIILMGDSIGDKDMANGVPASSHIIKIGFLFDNVEANIERYMDAFDIVLVDDQTMELPLQLLNIIKTYHKK